MPVLPAIFGIVVVELGEVTFAVTQIGLVVPRIAALIAFPPKAFAPLIRRLDRAWVIGQGAVALISLILVPREEGSRLTLRPAHEVALRGTVPGLAALPAPAEIIVADVAVLAVTVTTIA